MRRRVSYDNILRARPNESLSLQEMQQRLPAIFAESAHDSRSKRYVYIPTREVLANLMKEGFEPVEARVSHAKDESRKAFTKHMVRLRHRSTEPTKQRAVGDTHFEVVLRNAHDGTAAYDFMAGLFRLVCLNGMVVCDGGIGEAHVRHTGNQERQMAQVIDAAYTVVHDAPKVLEAPRRWSEIVLNRDEQMAMAESAKTIRFEEDSHIEAKALLIPRREVDNKPDLWTTFNVIQENAVRGGLTSAPYRTSNGQMRRITTREVRGIDSDIRLNKSLWQLGIKMAELKTA